MAQTPQALTCEIELKPGQELRLPRSLLDQVGPGRWLITLQPLGPEAAAPVRDHRAFLNSYAPEDEGLYDADPAR
jgi:hypothetical protein